MTRMLAGVLALGLALVASGAAFADGRDRGVPAPIPVPAPMPIPESFSYYLRADLGWAFIGSAPSFSESGITYVAAPPLTYGGLSDRSVGIDDVFFGNIGAGAYLTSRFRADVTLDFRGTQDMDATGTYINVANNGTVTETIKLRSTVGLVNAYWDLFPRGSFTPYVGAGVGFVYNDIYRRHLTAEDTAGVPPITTVNSGSGSETGVGLAAALMAGVTLAQDHRWALDINYRALYLDGGSVTTTVTSGSSRVDIGSHWEHQFRIGLRANIW